MKFKSIFRAFLLLGSIGCMAFSAGSCTKEESTGVASGVITGTVTSVDGEAIEGVTVTARDLGRSAETGADGTYTLDGVPVSSVLLTFTAEGFQTTNITVPRTFFDNSNHAVADVVMNNADAVISGMVYDGDSDNGDSPLSGATVTLTFGSKSESVTTGEDGTYRFENMVVQDYAMSVTHSERLSVNKSISADMFTEGQEGKMSVSLDITMFSSALLPGLSIDDLKNADKWYYNEYRGGNQGGPNDWSVAYMSVLDFHGAWQNQGEGVAIQIQNTEADRSNPGNLDVFDSFVYGSKLITEDNKILTLNVRTHDKENQTVFGVQVIDLSETEPSAKKVGSNASYSGDTYKDFHFDLSEYIGKEVIIAIGTYREQSGDYYRQLVLKHIAFTSDGNQGAAHISGNAVSGLEGWYMTQEMVRSTMPNEKKSFNANTPGEALNNDDYLRGATGYHVFRGKNHIIQEWGFMHVSKDVEPHRTEGFIIKTNNDANLSTTVPSSYFYAKLPVSPGSDKLTFNIRSFSSSSPTYFKVTAITEDCTVKHLSPAVYPEGASEAMDGCWKFAIESFSDFTYDLSEFDGQDVMITIGVFKGENSNTEDKLCFHEITLN